jgi:gamma-glutamyltranspeptidase/glutathione hydrolase
MPYVSGRNGAVAAASPLAACEALRMLMNGGNAIDAAIVAAAVLSVDEPYFSGPGGHGIALVHDAAAKDTRCLDFGGSTPQAFTIDQWGTPPAYPRGSVVSAIFPAMLAGWAELLARYGTISLSDALQPAIIHAARGVVVRPVVASFTRNLAEVVSRYPELAGIFMPDGELPREGHVIRYPALAETFSAVAREGVETFYRGELAQRIVRYLNAHGSRFTMDEFENYRPKWRDTLSATYRDRFDVIVPRCQVCSPCVLTQLNIWEQFDISELGLLTTAGLHVGIEAAKVAFEDRSTQCGDPDFYDVPYDRLASKSYANQIAQQLDLKQSSRDLYEHESSGKSSGTTHLTVVDRERNVAAITQTLGPDFGCMHVVPETGIILNSEGLYFDLVPEFGPNYPQAGKLPQHDMCPTIVLKDGELFLSLGTPGAQGITQTIPQVISKVIDHGMSIQAAIESSRYRYYGGGRVQLDDGIDEQTRIELGAKGHQILPKAQTPIWAGAFNAVMRDPDQDVLVGGADPRRGGLTVAY